MYYQNNNPLYPASLFPPQMQIFSGSVLKLIACITMLIDHTGHVLLSHWPLAAKTLFTIGERNITLYRISRDIGRVAFPIFCFLLVEGFWHTSNRFRYARNLLLSALLAEIPFNMVFQENSLWDATHQNVFFTLFFGFLAIWAFDYFKDQVFWQFSIMMLLYIVSYNFNADYGVKGYLLILIMFFLRDQKIGQTVLSCTCLYWEWRACFAFISINMYNGKRGFIKGNALKYFFYLFYPVHLFILVCLRYYLFLK